MNITIEYGCEDRNNIIAVPGSKSIAARALILSFISPHYIRLSGLPDCDDTLELTLALQKVRQFKSEGLTYNLGSGGTSLRFFLALAASLEHFNGVIKCSDALRPRPLYPLVEALREAGADIQYLRKNGQAPIRVKGRRLHGLRNKFQSDISSQFASALMMASLLWENSFVSSIGSETISAPYLEMTARMISQFEMLKSACPSKEDVFYKIEPDWSSASYFYELILADPSKKIVIEQLTPPSQSLQGDSECANIFRKLGINTDFREDGSAVLSADSEKIHNLTNLESPLALNLRDNPDLVPALAAGLCLAGIKFHISGISHLKYKESNRLETISQQLALAGFEIFYDRDSLGWNGQRIPVEDNIVLDSRNDHRIAMAMSMTAVKLGKITLRHSDCVSKSFNGFFNELEKLGFKSVYTEL